MRLSKGIEARPKNLSKQELDEIINRLENKILAKGKRRAAAGEADQNRSSVIMQPLFVDASCHVCGTKDGSLLKCAGCLSVLYCCVDHQRSDWKTHKQICKKIKRNFVENSQCKASTSESATTVKEEINPLPVPVTEEVKSSLVIEPECKVCHSKDAQLLKCSGCKSVWYCSVEHQRLDWKIHKQICVKKKEQL